jgi:hypothetical protein
MLSTQVVYRVCKEPRIEAKSCVGHSPKRCRKLKCVPREDKLAIYCTNWVKKWRCDGPNTCIVAESADLNPMAHNK